MGYRLLCVFLIIVGFAVSQTGSAHLFSKLQKFCVDFLQGHSEPEDVKTDPLIFESYAFDQWIFDSSTLRRTNEVIDGDEK